MSLWQSGLRQNRLAQALQMDEALLSRIINGYRQPTPEQRTRIAEILHRDETWLFAHDSQSIPAPAEPNKDSECLSPAEPVSAVAAGDSGRDETMGPGDHSQA
jgi:transcriptional regulator with XRE-family HTH domain